MCRRRFFFTILAFHFLPAAFAVAVPPVQGRIETIGPFRVLRVWGTPHEMGFAHGFLVGKEFLASLDESYEEMPASRRNEHMELTELVDRFVQLSPSDSEEIEGLFAGLLAAHGGPPQISFIHRQLSIRDLILHNAGDLVRALGCSGFTVWGERAGADGSFTARNFDFPVLNRNDLARQMILVRQPSGRRKVATVTWPGYIGAFSGFNDDGVCAFLHDGHGPHQPEFTSTHRPLALQLRDFLEQSSRQGAHDDAEAMLRSMSGYPFSYLVRIAAPRDSDSDASPERVFRVDAGGLSENPVRSFCSITTNHYLNGEGIAVTSAGMGSLRRFTELERRTQTTVTGRLAWEALRAVASDSVNGPTLHALIVYHQRRSIDLAFAEWKDKPVPATTGDPTSISFERIFQAD